jgi:hypothetical protein
MAVPATRQNLIDYCLRKLGAPVLEINVDGDQLSDRIDDALQVYREFHSDATVKGYLMMLNDIADLQNFAGDLAYYDQMQQYLSLLDTKLNGHPIVNFSRKQNRLYIYGDMQDGDIKEGDYIVAETYSTLDPNTHTSIYDDMWLKEYSTALIKQQWGMNLIKFEGMQLPGGVTLNGRQLFDDATQELERLMERIRLEQELPPDFFVG